MSAPDSSAQIVARFLRANHYNETLEAFIREAGLEEDAGSLSPGAWSIEQILQEKLQFDTSVNFEKLGGNEKQGWNVVAPKFAHEPNVQISSNVLCIGGDVQSNNILVTTADRKMQKFSASSPYSADETVVRSSEGPILSATYVANRYVLTSSMSGHLSLRRTSDYSLIDECRHHNKYAVHVASYQNGEDWFVATAGWDQRVHVYSLDISKLQAGDQINNGSDHASQIHGFLGDPVHTIMLSSNPESLVFACDPDTDKIYLVVSRRDSTHLGYYLLQREPPDGVSVTEAGRQNLAPHSNAWVAFTPCSLTLCPTDPTLLAVATSHLPHMKLIIVRLLFPNNKTGAGSTSINHQTQASMARAELALQDREDAAISIQVTTLAPQTPYSTPQVVWRPDGSGVFVNGDDGAVRGVETTTGKVISILKGHEAGSKVRTLWAGQFNVDGKKQELLVSGGFDKKLLVWTTSGGE